MLIAACTLLLSALATSVQDGKVVDLRAKQVQTTWTTEDGLSQNTVVAILQTTDGYLWVGTFGGLSRFDGVRFKNFDLASTPELGSSRILSLFEDSRGVLWIGTQEGGVTRYRDGSFEHLPPGSVAPSGQVWSFAEDADGTVWVGGSSLVRFSKEGVRTESPPLFSEHTSTIRDLYFDRENTLWVSTDRGLGRHDGVRFETLEGEPGGVFGETPAGVLWVTQESDVGIITNGSLQTIPGPAGTPETPRNVQRGHDGRVWILTSENAFLLSDELRGPPEDRFQPVLDPPPPGGIRSLYEDRERNLWVGLNGGGLVRLRTVPFAFVGEDTLAAGDEVIRVAPDGAGGVLVFPAQGVPQRYTGDTLAPLQGYGPESSTDDVSLTADGKGRLWSIDPEEGLLVRDGDAITKVEHGLGGPALALCADAQGTIWAAGNGRLAHVLDDRTDVFDLPSHADVLRLCAEDDGSVWVLGVGPSIARWQRGSITNWAAGDGLPRAIPRDVHVDSDGVAWIATYGSGLVRIQGQRVDVLSKAQGLPDDYLGGILEDGQQRLWINSNQGVFYVSRADLEDVVTGRTGEAYFALLPTGEGNGGHALGSQDGRMWFPTTQGIAIADPRLARPNQLRPHVVIEGFRADGESLDPRGPIRLPPGASWLEIDYTALTLTASKQARFRYRLDGHDEQWMEAGTRRTAVYTNIDPGTYHFKVIACNESQEWNTVGASIELTLEPYFYQSDFFAPAVVAALSLLLFASHRARTRALMRHNSDLQREIGERERAEAESHALGVRLRESQKLEAIGRLAGGVAHDFNNILTVVLGRAELLVGEPAAADEVQEHATEIVGCARRAAALTRQLLAFGRQQVLRPQIVDPNSVLQALEPILERLIPESIALTVDTATPVGLVEVDPHQLEQVVMNLVVNGRDAMPDGGELRVSTQRVTLAPERPLTPRATRESAVPQGNFVEIAVSDTGVGIPEANLENVFEPFFTTKPVGAGTGLGLASVHGIVRQSGGFVAVESEPGRGTTFRVRLPRSAEPAESPHEDSELPDSPVAGTETILICDDNAAVLNVTRAALEQHGYHVLTASKPSKALRLAKNHTHAGKSDIALLIADIVMPGMGGEELYAAASATIDDLRVIFFSGFAPPSPSGWNRDLPPILQKPVDLRDLLQNVRDALDSRRPHELGL